MIQLLWLTLLAVHTGAAGVWWWMMPGGYPSSATEFWVNQAAPPVAMALLITALFARGKLSAALLPSVLAMIPIFWMAFAISSRIVFFASFESAWHLPFVLAAAVFVLWARHFRARLGPKPLVIALGIVAAVAGWSFPGTQRAPEPATQPRGAALAEVPRGPLDHKVIKLTRDAQLRPADARLVVRRDKLVMNVHALLSFTDRSPDRCWTALAPENEKKPTNRTLTAKLHDGARSTLVYKDEDVSVIEATTTKEGAVQLDARSRLPQPVYSHLNSFAELSLQGHHLLSVSFSPAPDKRIEVASPTAPARFAYLDEAGIFHVMEATMRTRGPFRELASGKLGRGDALSVTIYDDGKPAFVVTLDDWAAQASTALSPTAGSGLPVNVIELLRGGDADTAPALFTFSLASTLVGRGTQSVGHAAGVYRNRITVKLP